MNRKTLIPNDFRDMLSIISILGMLAIFLRFSFNIDWLDQNLTYLFLFFIGLGFLFSGQFFSIRKWASDGIQGGEIAKITSIVLGVVAIIMSIFLLIGTNLPETILGVVGILGLISAVIIFADYLKKNR